MQQIDRRIEAMEELGIGVLQSGTRPWRNFAYMSTEPLAGTIIEFREQIARVDYGISRHVVAGALTERCI
ncbi:MAG: hypothetical protein IT529_10150 [Burkholderiales bacterium]|nr:hypothetical protein [Burkholderiales bacterium]